MHFGSCKKVVYVYFERYAMLKLRFESVASDETRSAKPFDKKRAADKQMAQK